MFSAVFFRIVLTPYVYLESLIDKFGQLGEIKNNIAKTSNNFISSWNKDQYFPTVDGSFNYLYHFSFRNFPLRSLAIICQYVSLPCCHCLARTYLKKKRDHFLIGLSEHLDVKLVSLNPMLK